MIDPEVFCDEIPLTNLERLELWRRKRWGMKAVDAWAAAHPGEHGLIEDPYFFTVSEITDLVRRQAD